MTVFADALAVLLFAPAALVFGFAVFGSGSSETAVFAAGISAFFKVFEAFAVLVVFAGAFSSFGVRFLAGTNLNSIAESGAISITIDCSQPCIE